MEEGDAERKVKRVKIESSETRKEDEHSGKILPVVSQKAKVISPITALLGFHLTHAGKNKATQTHTSASTRCSSQSFQTHSLLGNHVN